MAPSSRHSFPPAFRETLTDQDLRKNSTLQSFGQITEQLSLLEDRKQSINTILDVGCNRGGFVAALGQHLDAELIYGIDIDQNYREQAQQRGVKTFATDVESEPFPIDDNNIDLILSFGLIEHLTYYDNLFKEADRVLDGGWFWVTTPNLGSWLNRIALLTGHQPRNVEISRERAAGTLPIYDQNKFLNHVHAPTYKALIDLLEYYDFDPVESTVLTPYQRTKLDALLDKIFSLRTAWGRRVSVLSRQR